MNNKDSLTKQMKECQYGTNCYRKNPNHFKEYSHAHLEKILLQSDDDETSESQYKIPSELNFSKDIILEQLKIINQNGSVKRIKLDLPSSNSITQSININQQIFKREDNVKTNKPVVNTNPTDNQQSNGHSSKSTVYTESKKRELNEEQNNQITPKNISDYIPVVIPPGQMAEKLRKASPYSFFLTAITDSKLTHSEPLTVTFQELLDYSLGEIESTVQFNFLIDIGWLLGHYYFAKCLDKPHLILYGCDAPELQTISNKKPQVTAIKVQMNNAFSSHHTKMMFIGYKTGSMRVIISTANLVEDDWHNRTQGLWISPLCEPMSDTVDTTFGDSPTGFRDDLLKYLVSYNIPKLQPWIARIRKTSFKNVNVFFIGSVPGSHRNNLKYGPLWGHPKVGFLLGKYCTPIEDDQCPIVAQSSSIGSLGKTIDDWVCGEFGVSLRKDTGPKRLRKPIVFKMIYPSFSNVKNSYDDLLGGGCLPYVKSTNDKQPWLQKYFHQWKSEKRYRSRAVPHIKTYCRFSNANELYWFLLTSANLSKAAWGSYNKTPNIDPPLRISNYEAGVLFIPKFILNNHKCFPLKNEDNRDKTIPLFSMPYDWNPLTPYGIDDTPFLQDILFE